VSEARKTTIAGIIKEFTDDKVNLSDPFIQQAIVEKVGKAMTLEPKTPPVSKTASDAAKDARKKASGKYPLSREEIKNKMLTEAKRKFKAVEKGQYVTIHIKRGRASNTVSGIFYGLGLGKNSARIGDDLPIPFFDMIPVDRAKFDSSYRAKQIKKYVANKCLAYNTRKNNYANDIYTKELEAIARENETRGYIRAWGKWRTPKSVTEYFIAQYIRQMPEVATNTTDQTTSIDEKQTGERTNQNADGNDTPATPPVTVKPDSKTAMNLRLDKVRSEIERCRIEIAGSRYGVDADQGFRHNKDIILMGRHSGDVDLILKKQLPTPDAPPKNGPETITYSEGPIKSVTFYYVNDILYKITEDYRIAPLDIMKDLLRSVVERYGKSKETVEFNKKEDERLARIAKIKTPCKGKHSFNKSGVCTKCGMRKADSEPPPEKLEQFHHWNGDVVTAELHLKLNSDKSAFEIFELTKEIPGVKKEQEAILEEERQKREEENKRKIRDQYKLQ
jgi:hypothetical protein